MTSTSLKARLAAALPKDSQYILHHISTCPTKCPALFAAPPGQEPEDTYCESHFLSVSIENDNKYIQIFALEVLIYTTLRLTTLFVSKADSTGYLHLLNIGRGSASPLKTIATTFLQYLIDIRARKGRRLVLSLFARAQNQYLFPGSVENSQKHVLDDRGLIRWWCRVVDPILEKQNSSRDQIEDEVGRSDAGKAEREAQAYIRVPGYDAYGTKTFFPRDVCKQASISKRWKVGDPLIELSTSPNLPERCMIPRFPDDPKARFMDTLDEELPDENRPLSQNLSQESIKRGDEGKWRSIRSLEQFWEAMSFRQECSSGRLVGFIWAVFPSILGNQENGMAFCSAKESEEQRGDQPSPETQDAPRTTPQSQDHQSDSTATEPPEETIHYLWPKRGRGEVLLPAKEYDEAGKFLLSLDYTDLAAAVESTSRWIADIGRKGHVERWGQVIIGEKQALTMSQKVSSLESSTNLLSAGLVRKKKRQAGGDEHLERAQRSEVNDLSHSLVRKKAKLNEIPLKSEG